MFPDQNQNQDQPIPAQPVPDQPLAATPVPPALDPTSPPAVPAHPVADQSPLGVPVPVGLAPTPVSPVPVSVPTPPPSVPDPLVPTPPPTSLAPEPPVPPAPAPVPDVPSSPVPAGPVVSPPTSPQPIQQSGYVPPAPPMQPAMPANGTIGSRMSGGKFAKLRIIIAIVVGLGVLGGGAFLAKGLLAGGGISVKSLVQDTANDVSFKRPKAWTKISAKDTTSGSETVFTEGGKAEKDSDRTLMVDSTSLGIDYDSLSTAQKQQVTDAMKKSGSNEAISADGRCKSNDKTEASDFSQPNYSVAISFDLVCNELEVGSKVVKAKARMVIGIKGDKAYMIGIAALDKDWSHSQKAFDEILNTFKPAS